MTAPKLEVPTDSFDYFLTGMALLCILIMLGLNLYYYDLIPERIPTHFNATGKPDGYGGKITLWIIFGLSIVVSGILYFTGRNPQLGNYSVPITEENAPRQYQNMQRMNRTLTAVLCLCFAYIHYAIIQTALGQQDGLGLWFLLLFLSLIFGIIAFFLYRAKLLE